MPVSNVDGDPHGVHVERERAVLAVLAAVGGETLGCEPLGGCRGDELGEVDQPVADPHAVALERSAARPRAARRR